jgi:hypothetical protein
MSGDPTHLDRISGQTTTGHEWDGIRELNTPLPRWWLTPADVTPGTSASTTFTATDALTERQSVVDHFFAT